MSGAAYPCQYPRCRMGPNNSVHKNRRRHGYHEYVPPEPKSYQPTNAARCTVSWLLRQYYCPTFAFRSKVETRPVGASARSSGH